MPWKYWSSFRNSKLTNIFIGKMLQIHKCMWWLVLRTSVLGTARFDEEKWIQCTNNDPTGKKYFLWEISLSLSYHVNWLCHCVHCTLKTAPADFTKCTVELHLAGLTGTARQPDMQKIRIIGFFFENILHWQFEVETYFYFTLHIYLRTYKH